MLDYCYKIFFVLIFRIISTVVFSVFSICFAIISASITLGGGLRQCSYFEHRSGNYDDTSSRFLFELEKLILPELNSP